MALQPGHHLGRYEILEAIGAGGMGEVYRARDTSLDRDIAIKILPVAFSNDAERLSLFEREAKAVSSLNHPHICTLHDIGNADGIDYMVMELIEGETLASRLERKALSFEEALEYGIQIADALACAHGAGVVHRDLKPGNVMVTKPGIKLLDFGLAKVQREDSGTGVDSATPTQQKDLTSQGAVLGTYRYMSPEQLEGREIDARTDIFAFGAVLYEMVTGKKAFDGASEASLIAAILDSEPDSITTSKALDWIVRTAIAKEPDDRWRSMHDVKLQLQRLSIVEEPEATRPSRGSAVVAWGVAAVAAMALVVSLMSGDKSSPRATKRFAIPPPEAAAFTWQDSPEISPDGSLLAFVAENAAGIRHLWIRPLDDLEARELPGTEGARQPFWKPDSRSIGFFAGGDMKRIEIDGTAPETLAPAPAPNGASWSRDGTIVFTPTNGPLSAVSDSGDDLRQVSVIDADQDEFLHRFPGFSTWRTPVPLYRASGGAGEQRAFRGRGRRRCEKESGIDTVANRLRATRLSSFSRRSRAHGATFRSRSSGIRG